MANHCEKKIKQLIDKQSEIRKIKYNLQSN